MPEHKYAKYIVTEPKSPSEHYLKKKGEQRKSGNYIESVRMFTLDDSAAKGAFYTGCVWIMDKKGAGSVQSEIAHSHDFIEVPGFVGTVPGNPRILGRENEFWLEDEQYISDTSCLTFVPRLMKHLLLIFRRIDHPIFFFTEGNGSSYARSTGQEY